MESPIGSPIASPVMNMQPAVQQGQLNNSKLSPFLEKIIDKKVNQVALNVLEWLTDKLCSYVYTAYRQSLNARMVQLNIQPQVHAVPRGQANPQVQHVAQKVLNFMDGAPFYDRTSTHRVEIKRSVSIDLISQKQSLGPDDIYVDNKRVRFTDQPKGRLNFGKNFNTQEMFATDVNECPELVMIYEREVTGDLKAWCVDTAKPVQEILQGGALPIGKPQDVFLANEITAHPNRGPIIVPFP